MSYDKTALILSYLSGTERSRCVEGQLGSCEWPVTAQVDTLVECDPFTPASSIQEGISIWVTIAPQLP